MLSLIVPEEEKNYRIDPRSVCALYLMLKLHFKGEYDVIHYNWKYSLSQASFNSRNDKRFFETIAYKYRLHDLTYLFVNSLLTKTDNWIGGMTSNQAIREYRKYDSMLNIYAKEFSNELDILSIYCKRENIGFAELFKYDRLRDSARIIKILSLGIIKYETFLILDCFLNLIDNYDKVSECFEWLEYSVTLKAYRRLLIIDKEIAVDIFVDKLKSGFGLNLSREKLLEFSKRMEK